MIGSGSVSGAFLRWFWLWLAAAGLDLLTYVVCLFLAGALQDRSALDVLLTASGNLAGVSGWILPGEWFFFWLGAMCLFLRCRFLAGEHASLGKIRQDWGVFQAGGFEGTLRPIQVQEILGEPVPNTTVPGFGEACFRNALIRFCETGPFSSPTEFWTFERRRFLFFANRVFSSCGILATLILAWGFLRMAGKTPGDPWTWPSFSLALALALFLLAAAWVVKREDASLWLRFETFLLGEVLPRLNTADPRFERLSADLRSLKESWVEESGKVAETIGREMRSGILQEFLSDLGKGLDGFVQQSERMQQRLHEKMLQAGDKLRDTAETLRLYVARGGVADTALLHKSLNDFRMVVNDLSSRFERAEQLIHELSGLPEAVEVMTRAGQAVRLGGEKTVDLAERLAVMSAKFEKIANALESEVVRNGEINASTEKVLSALTLEIAALKGVVSSINVSMVGVQQAVQNVQQSLRSAGPRP